MHFMPTLGAKSLSWKTGEEEGSWEPCILFNPLLVLMLSLTRVGVQSFCTLAFFSKSFALIISSQPASGRHLPKPELSVARQETVSVARIRSTRRSDIEPISELLSSVIVGHDTKNWKAKIERLWVKSSVQSTLDLRVRAMEEDKKCLSQRVGTAEGKLLLEVNNPGHLRYLWSRDSFRNKIAQAAEHSSEPHPWERHDFALPPKDPRWLRHEMITAEDVGIGEVVGFCEIAMLSRPCAVTGTERSLDHVIEEDELDLVEFAPTIVNVVVSSDWRRRGVAKRLVKSAERFVKRKWWCDELGLYVDKRNQRAMNLYYSVGYQVKYTLTKQDESNMWYMSKEL